MFELYNKLVNHYDWLNQTPANEDWGIAEVKAQMEVLQHDIECLEAMLDELYHIETEMEQGE